MYSFEKAFGLASDIARCGRFDQVVVEKGQLWATDGHRGHVFRFKSSVATGIYGLDGVLDSKRKAPPLDRVIPKPVTMIIEIPVLWIQNNLEPLREMVSSRHSATAYFGFYKPEIELIRQPTVAESKKKVQPKPVKMALLGGPEIRSGYARLGLSIGYLCEAVQDLGFLKNDAVQIFRENPEDELAPVTFSSGNGNVVIMPVRY